MGKGDNYFLLALFQIDVQTYSILFSSLESNRIVINVSTLLSRGRWAVYDLKNNVSRSSICNEENTKEGYRN
ncbi:unnamed protein product [Brugia pahangi]|uniref:Uncharacterized protein n=1 Tax=Brugia pahangi TaxID=6280 RepID=A0A0N4T7L7_BRUPA|nr:unnamed protein product [Brugia pahangi]